MARISEARRRLHEIETADLKTTTDKINISIAYAFVEIADELYNLGTRDASTPMGALELLAMELRDGLQKVSENLASNSENR